MKKYTSKEELAAEFDKHCATKDFWEGEIYGFMLTGAQRIDPIPLKGKLNFLKCQI